MRLGIDFMGKIELLQFVFFASRTKEKFGYKTNSCSEMAFFPSAILCLGCEVKCYILMP